MPTAICIGRVPRAVTRWVGALLLAFVADLTAVPCHAYDVLLRWTVPPDVGVAGYRVVRGPTSRMYDQQVDVGPLAADTQDGVVCYLYRDLSLGTAYYLAVTAYNTNAMESDYSNEKVLTLSAVTPPPVDAGPDQTGIVGSVLTLGSAPTAGVGYFWQQTAGAPAVLSTRTSSMTQFTAPAAGTFQFVLTAYDALGVAAQAVVNVVIAGASTPTPTRSATRTSTRSPALTQTPTRTRTPTTTPTVTGTPTRTPTGPTRTSTRTSTPTVTTTPLSGKVRLYLTSVAPSYLPTQWRGSWENPPVARVSWSPSKAGALSNALRQERSRGTTDVGLLWAISDPIVSANLPAGSAVDWGIEAAEQFTDAELYWHMHLYVLAGNTDTVRCTLLPDYRELSASGNEWPVSSVGMGPKPSRPALTPCAVQSGDRLAIEIGYVARNTIGTGRYGLVNYGTTDPDVVVGATGGAAWVDLIGASVTFLGGSTPTPSTTPPAAATSTLTRTRSATPTMTASQPPTTTRTPTLTFTATRTATLTPTRSFTATTAPAQSATVTRTATSTPVTTQTATRTLTSTGTATPLATLTSTPALTATTIRTQTPTVTRTASAVPSTTSTPSAVPTRTATVIIAPTRTTTVAPVATSTATRTLTATGVPMQTATVTRTATTAPTSTKTPSAAPTQTTTATVAPTLTRTVAPVATSTPTRTFTATVLPTQTATVTQTATTAAPATSTPSSVPTQTGTETPPPSVTSTATPAATSTPTGTFTTTAVPTETATVPLTATETPTSRPTQTSTATSTPPPSETPTAPPTLTPTFTSTATTQPAPDTPTSTAPPTATPASTDTPTATPSALPTELASVTPTETTRPAETPTPDDTATPTAPPTFTPTLMLVVTPTETLTSTPIEMAPTETPTVLTVPNTTDTPVGIVTPTDTPTLSAQTATPSETPTPTATPTDGSSDGLNVPLFVTSGNSVSVQYLLPQRPNRSRSLANINASSVIVSGLSPSQGGSLMVASGNARSDGTCDLVLGQMVDSHQRPRDGVEVYHVHPDRPPERMAQVAAFEDRGLSSSGNLVVGDVDPSESGDEIVIGEDGSRRRASRLRIFGGLAHGEVHLLVDFQALRPRAATRHPLSFALGHVSSDSDGASNEIVVGDRMGHVYVYRLDGARAVLVRRFSAFPDPPRASAHELAVGDLMPYARSSQIVVADDGTRQDGLVRVFDGSTGRMLVEFEAFEPGEAPAGVEIWVADVIPALRGAELIVGQGAAGGRLRVFTLASGVPKHVVDIPDPLRRTTSFRRHLAVGSLVPNMPGRAVVVAQSDPRFPVEVFDLSERGARVVRSIALSDAEDTIGAIAVGH